MKIPSLFDGIITISSRDIICRYGIPTVEAI